MAEPYVRIIEQPVEKLVRFRYESEGRMNCAVLGNESTRNKPSYPKIEIGNVTGTVIVLISCITNDAKQRWVQSKHIVFLIILIGFGVFFIFKVVF